MDEELFKLIEKAARKVAFNWPGVIEEEDLRQDIAVRLLESPGTLEALSGMVEVGVKLDWLRRIAQQIASGERTSYEHFTGNFKYSVDEVRKLLGKGSLDDTDGGIGSSFDSSDLIVDGGKIADGFLTNHSRKVDLDLAMDRLASVNERYHGVIVKRYVDGKQPDCRMTLSRAVDALTVEMNRSFKRRFCDRPDGPGTRKAMSNSAAYVISQQQYSGSFSRERSEYADNI